MWLPPYEASMGSSNLLNKDHNPSPIFKTLSNQPVSTIPF